MSAPTFKNGCVELPIIENEPDYNLTTASIASITVQKVDMASLNETPVLAQMIIVLNIRNAVFHAAPKEYKQQEWDDLSKKKAVCGFVSTKSNEIANDSATFIYTLKDGKPDDTVVGNQISVNFTEEKIGGAG